MELGQSLDFASVILTWVTVVVVVVVVTVAGLAEGLAVGYVSPRVTPPLVVDGLPEGVDITGDADGKADPTGASSKLGLVAVLEGEGDAVREGSLIVPSERSAISPIAPIIIATTRPAKVDFMSYILYLLAVIVKLAQIRCDR